MTHLYSAAPEAGKKIPVRNGQYIYQQENVPFSFGAWNENIEGMYRRIKLIDSLGGPLRNAFIVMDVDGTFTKSDTRLVISLPIII